MRNYVALISFNVARLLAEQDRKPAWLAKKSSVKAPNLSRLLKGEGNPTIESIGRIAEAFGVEPQDLLLPEPGTRQKDEWSDISKIEADRDALVAKRGLLEAMFAEEIRASVLDELWKSREILTDRINHLQGRIDVLKHREKSRAPEDPHSLEVFIRALRDAALNQSQLRGLIDTVQSYRSPRTTKAPRPKSS